MSGDLVVAINPEEYIAKRYADTLAEVPVMPGESEVEARRREMFYKISLGSCRLCLTERIE